MSKNKHKQQQKPQAPAQKAEPAKQEAPKLEAPAKHQRSQSNPMHVQWPTDPWGFTRELRKAILLAASKTAGDKDKKKLLDETLAVGLSFIEAKFKSDEAHRAQRLARANGGKPAAQPEAPKQEPEAPKEPEAPAEELESLEEPEAEGEASPENAEDAYFGDEAEMDEPQEP